MLNEKQKTLLFYVLDATQKTLYWDKEEKSFAYDYQSFLLQVNELNNVAKDMNELNELIDKTLDDLCK